jgi:hypothetical protein
MPCNSDYMAASGYEIALSRVACLLDEIEGKPINQSHWHGYHPRVYSRTPSKAEADEMVARLCSFLRDADVTRYSLEMQMWWRDHLKADQARIEREHHEAEQANKRKEALSKLTPEERKALGLE